MRVVTAGVDAGSGFSVSLGRDEAPAADAALTSGERITRREIPYDLPMRARARMRVLVLIVAAAAACDQPLSPTVDTGLTGVVVRGPIAPVCEIDRPCDAPFSAAFDVYENTRRVAGFRSDAEGRFTVMIPAGTYRIIPSADAPIIQPPSQVKTVEVRPVGLTQVRLEFDTGIR